MTKLCPRGKAAAKRKFKVYPSAYANAYASRICAGKIKDPSGVKRKDFKGPKKAMGGVIDFNKIAQGRKENKTRIRKSFITNVVWLKHLVTSTLHQLKKGLVQGVLHAVGQRTKTKEGNLSNTGGKDDQIMSKG